MPKTQMQSVKAELDAYVRDELPRLQGRGLVAELARRLRQSDGTMRRAYDGEEIGVRKAREILARIAETKTVDWPGAPGQVWKKYEALQAELEPEAFARTSELMDMMAAALLDQASFPVGRATEVEKVFWHYLRGHIAKDRAAHILRTLEQTGDLLARDYDRCEQEKAARRHYRDAHALLSSLCETGSDWQLRYGRYVDKLRLNMLSCTFNLHPPGKRSTCVELVKELQDGEYLALVEKLSGAERKSRTIQHAGLVIASVLGQNAPSHEREKYIRLCAVFYSRLCMADERFVSLDHCAPDLTHTLARDPDLVFWRANRPGPSDACAPAVTRAQMS